MAVGVADLNAYVIPFPQLRREDVAIVGGKNSSLGEMISGLSQAGVQVPGGFSTTAQAYRDFLAHDDLAGRIRDLLATLDVEDVTKLATAGARIRGWILGTALQEDFEQAVLAEFRRMSDGRNIAAV